MTIQAVRELINQYNSAATGLAALGTALDARVSGTPLEPALAARVDELLEALGGKGVLDGVTADEARPALAELRLMAALDHKLLNVGARTGWQHTETEILQNAGDTSAGFAHGLTKMVVPALDGLADRFGRPDAKFLDVGVGVASLSIAMAKLWPDLGIVGIDPWQPSLQLARKNVERAGFANRIELREQGGETLEDDAAFDLAWVPVPFLPEWAIGPTCKRVLRALRPGGWLMISMIKPGADARTNALTRLRTTLFGGPLWDPDQGSTLLRDAGFEDVRTLSPAPGSIIALVVGRRRPDGR